MKAAANQERPALEEVHVRLGIGERDLGLVEGQFDVFGPVEEERPAVIGLDPNAGRYLYLDR